MFGIHSRDLGRTSLTPSSFATTKAPRPADPKTTAVAIPSALNARKPLTGSPLSSSDSYVSSGLATGEGPVRLLSPAVRMGIPPFPLTPSIVRGGRLKSKCEFDRNSGGGRASLAACLA